MSINTATGVISGTLAAADGVFSPYTVTLSAADSANPAIGASGMFQWTVDPAVTLTNPGALTNASGDTIALDLSATDSAGNPVNYGAANLPPGLAIDPLTGAVSGTISSSAYLGSPYTVAISATDTTDAMASASQTFQWTVNSSGVVTVSLANPGNQGNTDGDTVSLALSAGDSAGHALAYSAANLPSGLAVNPATGAITGVVAGGASAQSPYKVTVAASDSVDPSIGASQTFAWAVHPKVTLTNPGSQTAGIGDTINLALSATDSASNALVYTVSNLPAGLGINPTTGVISGTVSGGAAAVSPYSVTVTALDTVDNTASASQTFRWTITSSGTVTVTLANPGNQTSAEDAYVALGLSATDSAGNPLVYSAVDLPPGLIIAPHSGIIWGTMSAGASGAGPYSVTVTAADSVNPTLGASQAFIWTVLPGVSLANPGGQINADGDTITLPISGTDSAGNQMNYAASGLPPGLTINPLTGLISGTLGVSADLGSPYTVAISATDWKVPAANASETFTWTVMPTGTVTVTLTNPGNQTNIDGAVINLLLTGTDSAGDGLLFSATGLPPGLFVDARSGVIWGTIAQDADNLSPYNVTLYASDSHNISTGAAQQLVWVVKNGITVTLRNPGPQSDAADDTVFVALNGTDSANNSLRFTASGLPSGLAIDANTGVISGVISSGAVAYGPYNVIVTVADAYDGTASSTQCFQWNVTNSPPVTLSVLNPGSHTNTDGDYVDVPVSANDSAAHAVVFGAVGLPNGLSINPATGLISGVIDLGACPIGPYCATVNANDSVDTSVGASVTFTWTISANHNVSVLLISPGNQTNDDGDSPSIALTADDSANNPVIFTATGLPPGLSISSATGSISGTIAAGDDVTSPFAVSITATDGTNTADFDIVNFIWTVEPAAAGVVTIVAPPNQSSAFGAPASLQLVGRDTDGSPVTYSATGLPPGLTLNSMTGLISGTISVSSATLTGNPYRVTVTAASAMNAANSASATFVWTITTNELTGPGVVPGNSTYSYWFVPPNGAANLQATINDANGNPATGATYRTTSWTSGDVGVVVTFSNTPQKLFICCTMQVGNTTDSWTQEVHVVQVTVPDGTFTVGNLSARWGFLWGPIKLGTDPAAGDIPALTSTANVRLNGPQLADPNSVQVGFIQQATAAAWSATYQDGYANTTNLTVDTIVRTPSLSGTPIVGQTFTDTSPADTPWYSAPRTGNGAPLLTQDSPQSEYPFFVSVGSTRYLLWLVDQILQFRLDVAATVVSTGQGPFYWAEASVNWSDNISGTYVSRLIGGGWTWTPASGITPPAGGWQAVGAPSQELISTVLSETMLQQITWSPGS